MNKKILYPAVAALLLSALAGCQNPTKSSSTPAATSSNATTSVATSTSAPSSSSNPIASSEEVIHVSSIALSADKTTLYVGDSASLSVSVLPANAQDKTYVITAAPSDAVTISGTNVTAVKAGSVILTATANDGGKTGTLTLTIAEKLPPVITISGEKAFTVAAGVELALPSVSAKDYLNNDLTSAIEVEDSFESGTLKDGKFLAKVAGEHRLSYYVEDSEGRYDEDEIVVTVTPANAENFDTTGSTDIAAIGSYGVFKENFAQGKKSPFAAITDGNNATYLSGTSEAIAGNSLIIDLNKTAGNAAYSVFFSAFSNTFLRDVAVTYTVSFQYKILTNNANASDVYFGLSWDGFDGINRNFVAATGSTQDQVYSYTASFPAANIPTGGNAYFFLFKLGSSSAECKMAMDSFTITAKETPQVTAVVPTSTQLQATNGFTWNWADQGSTVTSGETAIAKNIEDATANAAIFADTTHFGANVMHLTGTDSHMFAGLTAENMTAGKKLTIDFTYYAVNDTGFNLIMMGTSGNPTQAPTVTASGSIKSVHLETTVVSGWYALNIYGANNPSFDIYVGNLTAKLADADPIPEGKTANGYSVGDSWTISARQWGNQDKGTVATSAFDDNAEAIANTKMGTAPTKFVVNGANVTMEWFQAGGKIENGCTYTLTSTYYIVNYTEGARFMYNFDNAVFLDVGPITAGFHEASQDWVATKAVDFFSFYFPDTTAATFYLASVTVTLKALAA